MNNVSLCPRLHSSPLFADPLIPIVVCSEMHNYSQPALHINTSFRPKPRVWMYTIAFRRPPLHTPAHPSAVSPHTIIFALSQPYSHSAQKIKCQIQYKTTNAATIMPLSLNIATLFPDAAMRVNRLAEPLRDVAMLEKVSLVLSRTCWSRALSYMSTVTPRSAETLDASSSRRESFCCSRS